MIDLIIFILHTCWFTIIHTVLRGPKGLLLSFHFLATLGEGREGDVTRRADAHCGRLLLSIVVSTRFRRRGESSGWP